MNPTDWFTDFQTVKLPAHETALSRRYLSLLQRWIPVVMPLYQDWPTRPRCGHFFGGTFWYGQETGMIIETLASVAASPDFDEKIAGFSSEALRETAYRGLRYLCFTHDTGPADCLRYAADAPQPQLNHTKWGERGQGFFKESQCGRTIYMLTVTAGMLAERLTDEDRRMLAAIAQDYLERFGRMEPKSGIFFDTQTEENGWTAAGLFASLLLLPGHPDHAALWENAQRWLFCSATMPGDRLSPQLLDGRKAAEWCGTTFTTFPDGTSENHGFVHPSYMECALMFSGHIGNLMKLFSQPLPQQTLWHRQDIYDVLKFWADDHGDFMPVQGMDWPFFCYHGHVANHALARVYLDDPQAADLEERCLAMVEQISRRHGGRCIPEQTVLKAAQAPQDPTIMFERLFSRMVDGYWAHRLNPQPAPAPGAGDEAVARNGVRVFPFGRLLVHRHPRGKTAFSWGSRTMILPHTRSGTRRIGGLPDSILAQLTIKDKLNDCRQQQLAIREAHDRVAALLIRQLHAGSVTSQVALASLPDGRCLIHEHVIANEPVTVAGFRQGYLCVINDGLFADTDDLQGRLEVFWEGRRQHCPGYPTGNPQDNIRYDLSASNWVNVNGEFGLVFDGDHQAAYVNRRHFAVWRAIHDDLILNEQTGERTYQAGQTIGCLTMVWIPGQSPSATQAQNLQVLRRDRQVFSARLDSFRVLANFTDTEQTLPGDQAAWPRDSYRLLGGAALGGGAVGLAPGEIALVEALEVASER